MPDDYRDLIGALEVGAGIAEQHGALDDYIETGDYQYRWDHCLLVALAGIADALQGIQRALAEAVDQGSRRQAVP